MEEQNWSPTGPGCPSPASLDLVCFSRPRLAAEEVALGPESTRLHVLPVSICFPPKPAGLGCRAGRLPGPPGSALCLCCSICCSTRSWRSSLGLFVSLSEPLPALPCSLPFLPVSNYIRTSP